MSRKEAAGGSTELGPEVRRPGWSLALLERRLQPLPSWASGSASVKWSWTSRPREVSLCRSVSLPSQAPSLILGLANPKFSFSSGPAPRMWAGQHFRKQHKPWFLPVLGVTQCLLLCVPESPRAGCHLSLTPSLSSIWVTYTALDVSGSCPLSLFWEISTHPPTPLTDAVIAKGPHSLRVMPPMVMPK